MELLRFGRLPFHRLGHCDRRFRLDGLLGFDRLGDRLWRFDRLGHCDRRIRLDGFLGFDRLGDRCG